MLLVSEARVWSSCCTLHQSFSCTWWMVIQTLVMQTRLMLVTLSPHVILGFRKFGCLLTVLPLLPWRWRRCEVLLGFLLLVQRWPWDPQCGGERKQQLNACGWVAFCRDALPDTLLPVKSCLPRRPGRLRPGMRWLDCPPRLEELRGPCLPWDWFVALDAQAKLGACSAACQGCRLHGRLWAAASAEACGWMLRQSAPAAAGLQRGDSSRLAFLHYLARGVSEPRG